MKFILNIKLLVIICLIVKGAFISLIADVIHFKNGKILMNVKVVREDNQWVYVLTHSGEKRFLKKGIQKIEESEFDPQKESQFKNLKSQVVTKPQVVLPYKTGFYLGVGLPYLRVGGEFQGNTFLISENEVIFIPKVESGFGSGFFAGIHLKGVGFEFNYLTSKKSATWSGIADQAKITQLNLDVFVYGKHRELAGRPVIVSLVTGGFISTLRAYNLAGVALPNGDVELKDAIFRGLGYHVGLGGSYYFTKRIFLNSQILFKSFTYEWAKPEGGKMTRIGGETEEDKGLKSGGFYTRLMIAITL